MSLSTEVNPKQAKTFIVLIILAAAGLLYMYVFAPKRETGGRQNAS